MSTFSTSGSETFNLIHARYIASKVATDLRRFQRFYPAPSDKEIEEYEAELTVLLKHDVVKSVVYGFQRNGNWTKASLRYTALPGGVLLADDDPGKIRPNLDVAGASFTSFLEFNNRYYNLSAAERSGIESERPFKRGTGSTPPLETGYWEDDLKYSAGGRGLGRATVR